VYLNEESIFNVLERFNYIEVENVADIESILADLGMSLTDFDPSIFHTEG
jgi:hypothetical protein